MTQNPWDFLPDDDEPDEPWRQDGPEEAALHIEDAEPAEAEPDEDGDPPGPDDERAPDASPRLADGQRWLSDEEPEPHWREASETADAHGDAGGDDGSDSDPESEDDPDVDPEAEDVETLLERQHYAFAAEPDDDPTELSWATATGAAHHAGNGVALISERRLRDLLGTEHDRLCDLLEAVERDGLHDAGVADGTGDLSHSHQHAADLGTETYEREVELSLAHDIEDELREVQLAVERLNSGRFGCCEACGEPIAAARLEVVPATRWCRAHASADGLTRSAR